MISAYWKNIKSTFTTSFLGLKTTFRHFREAAVSRKTLSIQDSKYFKQDKGLMTLQYPQESFPVPDNGRYKLHNEIDDCIVCDKCAKICPVDCIDIEPIKATGTFGYTLDGTPKRIHAAKFDIDMGKCCFCGLCTTVCPTECLTMTKSFDFSEYDVDDHNYSFATMTPLEILQKKQELEEFNHEKQQSQTSPKTDITKPKVKVVRPVPKVKKSDSSEEKPSKPKFKPRPMMKRKKKDD